jgi:hypothetical protein
MDPEDCRFEYCQLHSFEEHEDVAQAASSGSSQQADTSYGKAVQHNKLQRQAEAGPSTASKLGTVAEIESRPGTVLVFLLESNGKSVEILETLLTLLRLAYLTLSKPCDPPASWALEFRLPRFYSLSAGDTYFQKPIVDAPGLTVIDTTSHLRRPHFMPEPNLQKTHFLQLEHDMRTGAPHGGNYDFTDPTECSPLPIS